MILRVLPFLLLFASVSFAETLAERFDPPTGYERVEEAPGSFGAFLRELPLKPGRPDLHYWNGRRTRWQGGHEAVVEMDLGQRDLQQCADTVIRLRAEYLRSHGRDDEIWFRFTSGDTARWLDWSRGIRPRVRDNEVSWRRAAEPDDGTRCFKRYLDTVYTYAGTASLSRDLEPVPDATDIRAGDVFIRGGYPGHAVIVADVAENEAGEKVFLLVQGYMPTMDVHVMRSREGGISPWHRSPPGRGSLGKWGMGWRHLKRFPEAAPARAAT